MQAADAGIEPLDFNAVSGGNRFQGAEPTGAVACQDNIPSLAEASSAEEACRTEGQGAGRCTFQNDLVIAQARDRQAGEGMRVGPRPWRGKLARLNTLLSRSPDSDPPQ